MATEIGTNASSPPAVPTPRPHLLLTAERTGSLRTLAQVRAATLAAGLPRRLWDTIRELAARDLAAPPLLPTTPLPGRDPIQAAQGNRDYTICRAVAQRLERAALVCLLSGDPAYRDVCLAQMRALFDPRQWPEWRDMAHQAQGPADLRTGQLSVPVALAYDWLYPCLSATQRQDIVAGLDRMGIQPYLTAVARDAWWLHHRSNWLTCVVGGLGIAGMALAEDHPDAAGLVKLAVTKMRGYLEMYGPEGEFNESPGYAGANRMPVEFFAAYRYHTRDAQNLLARTPFPDACRWVMQMTQPPGNPVPFGDTHLHAPVCCDYFAAVAAATRDPLLQWFYQQHADTTGGDQDSNSLVYQLLHYDATLTPVPPTPVTLPLARAYRAHGAVIASRSDWDPRAAACCVFSKSGLEQYHENHDVGTVLISGYGRQLITDPGSLFYPADFFGPNRWRYYNASVCGHNLPMFGGRETRHGGGRLLEFAQDSEGASWSLDLTRCYDGAVSVRRRVVHRLPGVVAVLDEVELAQPEAVTLRWHTANDAEPDAAGHFLVENQGVRCAAWMGVLPAPGNRPSREGAGLSPSQVGVQAGGPVRLTRGHHEYRPPFDRNRMGGLLTQRHESYVELALTARTCRILSLFAVFGPAAPPAPWTATADAWTIATPAGCVQITLAAGDVALSG